jgi:beta-lactamase class A
MRVTIMRRWARRLPRAAALPALVIPALALLAAGCSGGSPIADPSTSPASWPSATRPATPDHASPFAGQLAAYLARRTGRVTAAVYDARTKRMWVFHPGVVEDTASIVKVQIMATALREAEIAGKSLPAAEAILMSPMIENSDNDAATSLLADVGGPGEVKQFDRLAGLDHTTPSTLALIPHTSWPGWGLTTTTAADQVRLVSQFAYDRGSVLTASDRRYGLNLMEHVEADQAWGISGGVAAGTRIALKNGWLPLANAGWQINSIGWVKGHGRDYVLAVLISHNPSEPYGIDTINAVAAMIYAKLGPLSPAR